MKGWRAAKLKSYKRIILESGNESRPGDVGIYTVWHPNKTKYLDIKPRQMSLCGQEVWVKLRDSYLDRKIYTTVTKMKTNDLIAYDIWFEWILPMGQSHNDFTYLPEELFEI